MEIRRHLIGTERGVVLAVVLALGVAALAALARPPVEPPLSPSSAGFLTIAALSAIPAVLVGAYDGGLLAAWLAVGVPIGVLWWIGTAVTHSGPTLLARLTAVGAVAIVVAAAVGTPAFLLGRGARIAWAARAA